jgi:hypothetical protein
MNVEFGNTKWVNVKRLAEVDALGVSAAARRRHRADVGTDEICDARGIEEEAVDRVAVEDRDGTPQERVDHELPVGAPDGVDAAIEDVAREVERREVGVDRTQEVGERRRGRRRRCTQRSPCRRSSGSATRPWSSVTRSGKASGCGTWRSAPSRP